MVGRDCCQKSVGVEMRRGFVVQTRLGSSGLITQVFLVLISCEREGEDGLILRAFSPGWRTTCTSVEAKGAILS